MRSRWLVTGGVIAALSLSLLGAVPAKAPAAASTQFALYLEFPDFANIAGRIQDVNLPNSLKTRAGKYWNGGFKNWSTAPLGHAEGDDACPLCRIVVVDPGPTGNLADFISLLNDISAYFGTKDAEYLGGGSV